MEKRQRQHTHRLSRRRVLAGLGATSLAGIAGCLAASEGPGNPGPAASVDEAMDATIQIIALGTMVSPDAGEVVGAGAGSGFFIDPSGIAVTNNHVVTGAANLEVHVPGEDRARNAQILGVSECTDLAVIDVEGDGFPYLELYEEPVQPNLPIRALGYPLGDPQLDVSQGIVSSVGVEEDVLLLTSWVEDVISHDAVTNPGNSGGPIVTEEGKVVAIHYAGMPERRQQWSIRADTATGHLETMRNGEDVESIGINGQILIDPQEGVPLPGIWVSSVAPGKPASDAGVRPGDIILRLQDFPVGGERLMRDYCGVLRTHGSDAVLSIVVQRLSTGEVLTGEINGEKLEPVIEEGVQERTPEGEPEGEPGPDGEPATYPEYHVVTDDTGSLQVQVPTEWTEIDGQQSDLGPRIIAAPSVDGFLETYDVPGVTFIRSTPEEVGRDPDSVLDQFEFPDCVDAGRDAFETDRYVGRYRVFDGCAGTETTVVTLAAFPQDQSHVAVLVVQLVDDRDDDALNKIIASFEVLEG